MYKSQANMAKALKNMPMIEVQESQTWDNLY